MPVLTQPGASSMSTWSQTVGVNLTSVDTSGASNNGINLTLTERVPPNWPFGGIFNQPGVQTTSNLARGKVENTAINLSNVNLQHVCDFKFIFQFGINLFGLTNPLVALLQAIKNGKMKAAAMIRAAMTYLVNGFRTAIKALLAVLGFDPSGQISLAISVGKKIIIDINELIKKIAQFVEDVAMVFALYNQIKQIIAWIQNLPAKIKQIVQACLTNFQNSINGVINQFKSIPGQFTASVNQVTSQFSSTLTSTLNGLTSAAQTSQGSLDPALVPIVGGSTSNADLANLGKYISNYAPTVGQAMANTFSTQASTSQSP